MEVTLVIVTLVSLALAIAMGVITWRLLQEERLRADARVVALEQGLAETAGQTPHPSGRADLSSAAWSAARTSLSPATADTITPLSLPGGEEFDQQRTPDDTDWLAQFAASDDDRPQAQAQAEPGADAAPVMSGSGNLFGQVQAADESGGLSRRAVAIAAVAAVMISAVLGVWTLGRLMAPVADAPRAANVATGATAGGATATGVAANGAASAALELVSLRHVQQDGTLTITGLVRNPHGGVTQERLTAVVFFFDGQGGFLSSTRAPLDFRALAPGDESPFQIATPAPPGVARFRVSFRRDEGAIVPHVDRRQQEASRS